MTCVLFSKSSEATIALCEKQTFIVRKDKPGNSDNDIPICVPWKKKDIRVSNDRTFFFG